jgi:putative nucleotidyltransferase with HDIG domain
VILPDTTSAGALAIADRLMERLSSVPLDGLGGHAVRVSIGVASYPDHALHPKELLDNAELTAFLASRDGHNRIRLFPTRQMDLDGLTPEAITRRYPTLAEVFQVLAAQGAKDHRTFVHAQEVAHYAGLVARELGVSHDEILDIGLAGWLHDVGKMTLPGLNGDIQSRLSQLPALNVKIHPAVGAYILKNLLRSPAILKGVLHHHARFDGLGQPSQLQGTDIPLEARILAVADTYQHLSKGTQVEGAPAQRDVFQSLRRKAGQELDPALVECLIRGVTVGS